MVKVEKNLVSQSVISMRTYGTGNPVKYITVHQTGNARKGANADMHGRLQKNINPRQASWHYQSDDTKVIQSFNDNIRCWANSDGNKKEGGNMTSINVELCINSDGDYEKSIEIGAKFVAMKLKEYKLGVSKVKRHFDWYNKNCPAQLMQGYKGITWSDFINKVRKYLNEEGYINVGLLRVDGFLGKLTIQALQRHFGTIVDGKLSSPSLVIRALQSFLNKNGAKLKVDGYFGTLTISALQVYFGTTNDGYIDNRKPSQVVKALQTWLNNLGKK